MPETPSRRLPLDGVRVIELGQLLAGPFTGTLLAYFGADVVKVEPPGGDPIRGWRKLDEDGTSYWWRSLGRNKKSVTLDLKSEQGKGLVRKLMSSADVVIENFRPGVMERLGLGAEALRAANPRLIYCCISGFGRAVDRPGYDLMVQGLSGIPSLTGSAEGPPNKCGASVADLVSGSNAVQGILAALFRRERTGEGALVDVSMLDGQLALLTYHASAYVNAGKVPGRIGNAHPSIHPFCTYATADGHINVCVGNDSLWATFCGVLGEPAWVSDPRFATNPSRVAHRGALDALLAPRFAEAPTGRWLGVLEAAGIPCGPMATVAEALDGATLVEHPHPAGGPPVRTVPLPFAMDEAPRAAERGAPALGQHRDEVLADWLGGAGRPAGG